MKTVSPITLIDKLIKKNKVGQPFTLADHQQGNPAPRLCLRLDSKLPYDTILYSTVKKARIRLQKRSTRLSRSQWHALRPLIMVRLTGDRSLFVGVDLATKHDGAAVVVVSGTPDGAIKLVSHRIWKPTPENPLDLERTVEWHLRELHSQRL
jgi:hypothetical protein